MKRDMDLVRELLLALEASERRNTRLEHLKAQEPFATVPDDRLNFHIALLHDDGMIEALYVKDPGRGSHGWNISRLTWRGCEFLDTIRDPEVWRRTKEGASVVGSWSVGLLKDLGAAYVKLRAKDLLGLDLG